MKEINELIREIGIWSLQNFGDNSNENGMITLGFIAPLIGLYEEYGEFENAVINKLDYEEIIDALGDMSIYICDFCFRIGVVDITYNDVNNTVTYDNLTILMGKLSHHVLKYCQSIREYADGNVERFRENAKGIVLQVLRLINEIIISKSYKSENLLTVLNKTWYEIVSKRNWQQNREKGV